MFIRKIYVYSYDFFFSLLISICIVGYSGSQIGDLLVHDADEENTINSLLTYKLLSQTPSSPSEGMFSIDQIHGRIQVAKHNFRRKDVPQYHLKISVTDGGKVIVLSPVVIYRLLINTDAISTHFHQASCL